MNKLHLFLDIINLIFPRTCYSCKSVLIKNERVLCIKCYVDLPKHVSRHNIHQLNLCVKGKNYKLYRRYKFQKKSVIQKLIYELKYNNKAYLGEYLGKELYKNLSHLENINYIIPVPLHEKKLSQRGYNQSELIAKGLQQHLKCELLNDVLLRSENTVSQTNKSRFHRFENMTGVFYLTKKKKLENKHIILLDDVFTTGATISECINVLEQIKNITITIVCVA
ncbi:MAG: ComF family protein [Flavobacteriales bacterium]|nr:ComF family protein [Flavobacteriales bacterium]